MLPEAELREALAAAPLRDIPSPWSKAVAFRHLLGPPPGGQFGDPPQPLWPGGAVLYGGRFTPRGSFGTIYIASDHETALREVQATVQPPGGPVIILAGEPWVVLAVEGSLRSVLDVTDIAAQQCLGTSLSELTGVWRIPPAPGHEPPTHTLGRVAYETGRITAIRYVSAKNPERGSCIAVFVDRLVAGQPSYLRVVDPHSNLAQRFP